MDATLEAHPIRPTLSRRQIASVVAGNGLEFYDFLTYSFFAAQIGRTLFPQGGGHGLALSLATFGVGFLTRPLGGIVIGRIADRRGRKPAMMLSFSCMGVALIGLALTPSYAAVGVLAPILAVCFRMLQGFALGGEVGPNTAYLLEAAPPGREGFYVSFQFATQDLAVMAAGLTGMILSSVLSPGDLDSYGWRIAFLLGASIVPLTLIIRRSLTETLHLEEPPPATAETRRAYRFVAIGGVMLVAAGTISGYTLNYLTTYAQTVLGLAVTSAFSATVMLGLVQFVSDLATGRMIDRFGAKRVIILPAVLMLIFTVPAFLVMNHFRTVGALLAMTAFLAAVQSSMSGTGVFLFTRALPANVRAGTLGVVYAVAVAVFGGSTQFMAHELIRVTGSPIAPAWYMTVMVAVGLGGIFLIREGPARSGAMVRAGPG